MLGVFVALLWGGNLSFWLVVLSFGVDILWLCELCSCVDGIRSMKHIMTGLLASVLLTCAAAAEDLTARVAELQIAMQQHIEQQKVDGAILNINFKTGSVEKLYPVEAHPMVIELSNGYALCSDLVREDGSTVPLDVYLVREGDELVVFETIISNRGPLAKLIKSGKATRIR